MEELAIRVKDIDIVDMGTGAKRGMVMGDTLQMFVNKATRRASDRIAGHSVHRGGDATAHR